MKRNGFAISGIVYIILFLFLILLLGILGILSSRKAILGNMQKEVLNNLNEEYDEKLYVDNSGANYPKLSSKMLPVVYDTSISKWVYADVSEKWYDYDAKMWANAIVLKKGINKIVGQAIEESEIAMMYVWIPRFKYTIFDDSVQLIDVDFEKNLNSTGTMKCADVCTDITGSISESYSTYTHPAFTFDDASLTGFWVGKYSNSTISNNCLLNSDNCNNANHIIEIKSNAKALTNINIANMFNSILNIPQYYGISASTHMIKNIEWGAVSYLKQSKYGLGLTDIAINGNSNYITGCNKTSCDSYTLTSNSSTTGNVYGVYDMAGGVFEYVMGVVANSDNEINLSKSGFDSLPIKYYDLYEYNFNDYKYGDGIKNTAGWYNDSEGEYSSSNSWIIRGGKYSDDLNAGIFSYKYASGKASEITSRTILINR